ncbi:tryptophan 7-halogenase [Streptomyces sp. NPDC059009]|uniref:tryptophan 7-halogenase n=1 Tax=Streptomyces sp. NPDC059009 TaxID=3346694 RepID=UPI0036B4D76C
MDRRIEDIVMVGGTLTAWTAAARLASAFPGTVRVTVLEPPRRTTAPTETDQVITLAPHVQRDLFDPLGIPEETWMRAASATFNLAVRHENWRTPNAVAAPDHFYLPWAGTPECENFPLSDFWRLRRAEGRTTEPYDYACFREPPLLDAGKSPRWLDGRTAVPYGWHADAGMLRNFLRRTAIAHGMARAVTGTPLRATRDENGMLTSLHTEEGRAIKADLFVDCTGRERKLFSAILGEEWLGAEGKGTDTVTRVMIPHPTAMARTGSVAPFSTLTALPDGWVWRRPLLDRTGVDHVHTLHAAGRSRSAWVKNCVALGEAAWRTDPLTPPGLTEVLSQLTYMIRSLPSQQAREAPSPGYDRATRTAYEEATDTTRLLYWASPRKDTAFWRSRHELPLSERLLTCLENHTTGLPPDPHDPHEARLRTLLTALDPRGATPPPALSHHTVAARRADEHFTRISRQQRTLLETLPTAYEYLHRLHTRGLPSPARTTAAA